MKLIPIFCVCALFLGCSQGIQNKQGSTLRDGGTVLTYFDQPKFVIEIHKANGSLDVIAEIEKHVPGEQVVRFYDAERRKISEQVFQSDKQSSSSGPSGQFVAFSSTWKSSADGRMEVRTWSRKDRVVLTEELVVGHGGEVHSRRLFGPGRVPLNNYR